MSTNNNQILEDSFDITSRWLVEHLGFLASFNIDINPEDFLPNCCPSYVKLSFVVDEIDIAYRCKGELKLPKGTVFEGLVGRHKDLKVVRFRFSRFEQPTHIELDSLKSQLVNILIREIRKEAEAHLRSWQTSMVNDID